MLKIVDALQDDEVGRDESGRFEVDVVKRLELVNRVVVFRVMD